MYAGAFPSLTEQPIKNGVDSLCRKKHQNPEEQNHSPHVDVNVVANDEKPYTTGSKAGRQ